LYDTELTGFQKEISRVPYVGNKAISGKGKIGLAVASEDGADILCHMS
jgi:hypothetical protein